jgi:hypothetical protein
MTTFQYFKVTPAQVEAMTKELTDGGAKVTTESDNMYEITGHGITANATYDPKALTLTVNVVSKPWVVLAGSIDHGIKKALGIG